MKLKLLCVGKLSLSFLREGAEEYAGRIRRYVALEQIELKEEKAGKKADPAYVRQREGERILQKIPGDAFVVVLDEKGENPDSEAFSEFLEGHMTRGEDLVLVIGGAYGVSPEVKSRANRCLSLSRMTFTHQMARMLVLEQIYRGLTILRNEPYHNR